MKTLNYFLILCAVCAYSTAGWAVDYTGSPTTFSLTPSGKVTDTPCNIEFDAGLQFRFISASGGNIGFETKMISGNVLPVDVEFYIKESTSDNIGTLLCANPVNSSTWAQGSTSISKYVAVTYTSGTRYYVAQINLTSGGKTARYYSNVVTVTASSSGGGGGDCNFSDLPATNDFYEATCFLSKRGVIDGNGSGTTRAEENIIRAEIAKASFRGVYSLHNRTVPSSDIRPYYFPSVYSDLATYNAQNSYYYLPAKALLYLEYNDGIAPFERNNIAFNPERDITRTDALKVLMETFNIKPDLSSTASYSNPDVNNLKNNNPLKFGYIYRAKTLGIIDDINTFRPFASCQRGEVFLMLYRIMTKIEAGQINDPHPSDADYFEPLNVTLQNISMGLNTESGVFRYESGERFRLDGVVPLNFNFSYNSYNCDLPDEFFGMYDSGQNKIITCQPLGKGWSHTYHSFVTLINPDGSLSDNSRAIVHWGGGTIHVYKPYGNGFVPESYGVYNDFDISGNVVTITDKSQTKYRFKKHGATHVMELESMTDRNGNQLTVNYESGTGGAARISSVSDGNRQLRFEYRNDNNILRKVIDPLGRTIEFQHSLNSKTGQYDILYASHKSFSNPNWLTTRYAYYSDQLNPRADGLLAAIKQPKGNFIQCDYDNNRRLTTIVTKDANDVIGSRVDVAVASNYTANSNSISSDVKTFYNNGSNSANYSNSFTFNPNNRPTQITGNLGYSVNISYNNTSQPVLPTAISTNNSNIQEIRYDNRGNVTQMTVKSLTGSATRTVSISYNSDNTVNSVTDPKGNTINYYYDSKGNLTSMSAPENATTNINVNAKGLPTSVTNPSNIVTEYAYDEYGNLQTTTVPSLGISSTINYDAASRVTNVLDFLNRTTSFAYDNNDNLLTETDALNRMTSYEYDLNGNLTAITNAKGGVTTLTYDDISDWLTSVTFGGATKSYEYNDDGSLKKFTKPDGTQLRSVYDDAGRIIDDGVNAYEYDNEHRLRKITGNGKSLTFGYDGFNQVADVTCDNKTVSYTYDDNGNVSTVTYPDNKTVTYTYDNLNRMKTVKDWNNSLITYNYWEDNRLRSVSYPNGMTVAYDYDNAGRQTGKTVKRSDNSVIVSYGFTPDKAGNIISENRTEPYTDISLPNENVSYAYNSANRITQAGNTSFTFDANGNTKMRGSSAYNYDNLDRLTSGDGFGFEYDGLGNIRSSGSKRYWIDIMGRGNVLAETDMSNNPTAYYLYGATGLEARILPNGSTEYYVSDYRGSVIAMVDASTAANITHKYQYDEFGNIVRQQESDANPFRYVGKYGVMYFSDNLYYMRARFYDPAIGRFLSEDPIWSTNLYPYADNNPVMRIDPDGLRSFEDITNDILKTNDTKKLEKLNNELYALKNPITTNNSNAYKSTDSNPMTQGLVNIATNGWSRETGKIGAKIGSGLANSINKDGENISRIGDKATKSLLTGISNGLIKIGNWFTKLGGGDKRNSQQTEYRL